MRSLQKVDILPSVDMANEMKQSNISSVMDSDDSGAADIVLEHYPNNRKVGSLQVRTSCG